MNILVNIPSLDLPGGVANHYKGLLPFWRHNVRYNAVGGRAGIPALLCLVFDYIKFIVFLVFKRFDLVLLNPSLGKTALVRDGVFLRLARLFHVPVVVFIHGWDIGQQKSIDSDPESFRRVFGQASAIIVLANEFVQKLRSWGVSAPIYLSTTKVDDRLLKNFDINAKTYGKTLLFLARIEPEKGIFVAIDAFAKLSSINPGIRFVIAGSGSALESAMARVESLSITNVEFLGNVAEDSLVKVFRESDVYILPTTYGEGMPTSVLEAMAFGLPVITRPVGGLKDFFENSNMGFISESLEPCWYADVVDTLFKDPNMMKIIGKYNHAYANKHFLASKVSRNIEDILENVYQINVSS